MIISSRTPEGDPNRCVVCGNELQIEPSATTGNIGDAPCPHCGCLVWFDIQTLSQTELPTEEIARKIRGCIKDFEQLSKSANDPTEYHREMLSGLVDMLAARGGAIWTRHPSGPKLRYGCNLGSGVGSRDSLLAPSHVRLIEGTIAEGLARAIEPASESNPTGSLLLLNPVKTKGDAVALVEIFQRTGSSPTVQRGYLRFMQQICDIAARSAVIGR
jgi:hypothetical protein